MRCRCATPEAGRNIGFKVNYMDTQTVFSVVQIAAMYFTKVREISCKWCDFYSDDPDASIIEFLILLSAENSIYNCA